MTSIKRSHPFLAQMAALQSIMLKMYYNNTIYTCTYMTSIVYTSYTKQTKHDLHQKIVWMLTLQDFMDTDITSRNYLSYMNCQ